ncbi:uncharacterized protein KY384_006134 [Bacidia gigantensis]|uniref:uncharacterized protein n=1 Tax=Bacidia gigantensis TaxID=2732470 RepID=UPI001D056DE2|nr:uncharacterized protein KY384_006134 [Bacidia gigantensis]KAG8529497.1 hypothetical protein KY384_006134 [Bacidia gigantensis]
MEVGSKMSPDIKECVDLNGNQYYYFRPSASLPIRRILQSNPQIPYSDINIPPQWHQWLRQTRPEPPSLQEQQNDLIRQQQLKVLARQADERWAQKASVLDKPRRANQELGVGDGETEGTVGRRWEPGRETAKGEIVEKDRSEAERRERENPWKRDRGAPGAHISSDEPVQDNGEASEVYALQPIYQNSMAAPIIAPAITMYNPPNASLRLAALEAALVGKAVEVAVA